MQELKHQSVLDKFWQAKPYDERLANAITQRFEISPIIAKLLAIRKINLDEVEDFLDPKIKNILPNPFGLSGIEEGVDHVIEAIKNRKKITIFADYDVDGATSSALLVRFFRQIDLEVEVYVPNRVLEGYGPNSQALLNLKKNGTDLVITVDCGTVAFKPLEDAKKAGLEVIVIDHHLGVLDKPEAIAVINPNSLNENFTPKNICAVTVAFLFAVAVNKKLKDQDFFSTKKSVNLFDLLDLVGLGTVCDVMPLIGLNRALVSAGLKILKQRKNLGLRQICDLAGMDSEPSAYSLGFIIGPRINAGGRVGEANLGSRILASDCEKEVNEIAVKLENFNKERKEIESQVLEEAVARLEQGIDGFSVNDSVIFAVAKNWHQGVIGIVASRLKDLYNKPVSVISIDETTNKAKASCRSIAGIDFGAEILNARLQGLLLEGGGHAMAGGFSLMADKLKDLHNFFCNKLANQVAEINKINNADFDLEIDMMQINIEFLTELAKLEPFGMGNARPRFLINDAKKIRSQLIGSTQDHVSCIFSAKSAIGFANQISGVAFRSAKNKVGEVLLANKNYENIKLIATLNINNWMGVKKVQILIEDVIV